MCSSLGVLRSGISFCCCCCCCVVVGNFNPICVYLELPFLRSSRTLNSRHYIEWCCPFLVCFCNILLASKQRLNSFSWGVNYIYHCCTVCVIYVSRVMYLFTFQVVGLAGKLSIKSFNQLVSCYFTIHHHQCSQVDRSESNQRSPIIIVFC